MSVSKMVRQTCAVAMLVAVTGCNFFLPPHPLSQDVDGERVEVEMLTLDAIASDPRYREAWNEAYPWAQIPDPSLRAVPLLAPLAAAAVSLAFDLVKKELTKEATRYDAQFRGRRAYDDFWIRKDGEWVQKYHAFRIRRWTDRFPKTAATPDPAFELVCGMAPSRDGKLMEISPLYFLTRSSKAKILNIRWWSVLWAWLLDTGERVDTSTLIEIEATWLDQEDKLHKRTVASVPVGIGNYSLGEDPVRGTPRVVALSRKPNAEMGERLLDVGTAGWFGGIPKPTSDVTADRSGAFVIEATTTERDPSKSREVVEQLRDTIEGQRETVIKLVNEQLGGAK